VVACVVSRDLDCGIDVESINGCHGMQGLARTVLAPSELGRIAAAPDTERAKLFCRYWTLKEAHAKALGLGMSVAFDKIAFELCEGFAHLRAHSNEWHFAQWAPTSTHILATAVRTRKPVRLLRHSGLPDKS
jgi:4'-phosphopantetheinyl transferase